MTLLILGLYLADIVTGLAFVLKFVLATLGILVSIFILLTVIESDGGNFEVTKKIFNSYYKKYLFALIFSVLAYIILPSKNTIYISTGLITGQKVMEQVQNNPLYEKSIKLLEKKIDEALSEGSETKEKKGLTNEN